VPQEVYYFTACSSSPHVAVPDERAAGRVCAVISAADGVDRFFFSVERWIEATGRALAQGRRAHGSNCGRRRSQARDLAPIAWWTGAWVL